MTAAVDVDVDARGRKRPPSRAKLSVLLVTDVYPPGCGGSGWSTHALAQALVARGHPLEVVSLDPSVAGMTQRVFEGIRVVEIGVRSQRRNPFRRLGRRDFAHDAVQGYLEARLQADAGVDLLHAQHLHSGPPAVAAAAGCGRASVVTVRDYWPVCVHGTSFWNGVECPGCSTADLTGCLREYQGWPAPVARLMVPWARRRLAARSRGIESAGRTVTVSNWVRRRIEPEAPAAAYEVLPNMVDVTQTAETARSAAPLDLPFEGEFLAAAGKLVVTKGFDRMLTALADAGCKLPLLIAGDGPERDRLRRRGDELSFDVFMPGWVPHASLLRAISKAHAFLLPSAWNEPLSRLLLEAMALGTPVISWRSGGNPEHLESGVDSFVVDDAHDLQQALAELARPGRAAEIGTAAARLARRQFSPDAVYPRLMRIYDAAIERGRRDGSSRRVESPTNDGSIR